MPTLLSKSFCVAVVLIALKSLPCSAAVVTTLADSGPGSLRAAIAEANSDGVATTITFDAVVFPAAAPATILVASQLPALTGAGDTIDGTGSGVIVDGFGLAPENEDTGLRARASNITIRAIRIHNFAGGGIRVEPAGNASGVTITGVLITQNTLFNNFDGIRVSGQAGSGNVLSVTILNNLLVRNRDDGIFVRGSTGDGEAAPPVSNGNLVEVLIDGNTIKGSQGEATGGVTSGDGIRVLGGTNNGSSNTVRATISNNNTWDNIDDGILVAGAGANGAASNNVVEVEVVNNNVRGPAKKTVPGAARGVGIRGGNRGGDDIVSNGTGNQIVFLVADNKVRGFRDTGILITGGLGSSHELSGAVLGNTVIEIGEPGSGVGDGVQLTGGAGANNLLQDIDIQENSVSRNVLDGIQVTGGGGGNSTLSNINIDANTSNANGRHGIGVFEGVLSNNISLAGITENVTNSNGQDGIFVQVGVAGSGATQISANRADRNGQDGVDIDASGYVLSNNTANRNVGAGINAVSGNLNGGGNTGVGNGSCNQPFAGCLP